MRLTVKVGNAQSKTAASWLLLCWIFQWQIISSIASGASARGRWNLHQTN